MLVGTLQGRKSVIIPSESPLKVSTVNCHLGLHSLWVTTSWGGGIETIGRRVWFPTTFSSLPCVPCEACRAPPTLEQRRRTTFLAQAALLGVAPSRGRPGRGTPLLPGLPIQPWAPLTNRLTQTLGLRSEVREVRSNGL